MPSAANRRSALLTERQARKLEAALAGEFDIRCWVAMRYWHPLTVEAAAAVQSASLDHLILLPLYPHYSFATTMSSLKEWQRVYRPAPGAPAARMIEEFHTHPQYIQALAERIATTFTHFDHPERAHMVFSAHGLPMSLIERGDPVPAPRRRDRRRSAGLRRLAEPAHALLPEPCRPSEVAGAVVAPDASIAWQRAGEKNLLVVPVSFVTEHIETLHEINIETREEAVAGGVEQFEMVPAVGDSPRFIGALADLVRTAVLTT